MGDARISDRLESATIRSQLPKLEGGNRPSVHAHRGSIPRHLKGRPWASGDHPEGLGSTKLLVGISAASLGLEDLRR